MISLKSDIPIKRPDYTTTSAFHIMGPVLATNHQYIITVAIVGRDNTIFTNPIVDTFDFPVQ